MNRAEKRRQQKLAKKTAKKARGEPFTKPETNQQLIDIPQPLALAMQHHTAGHLPEAEKIYQQVLQTDPNHPVALHLLGVIAHQVGKHDTAVDLISRAVAIKPDYADAHSNLGNALIVLGKLDEAVASYIKALAVKPNYAEAHSNLGNAFKALGKLDEAVASYNKALAIKPDYAEAQYNLGNALKDLGKLGDAIATYNKALTIKPDYAEAYINLGNALHEQGKLDDAVASYNKALAIKPDYVDVQIELAIHYYWTQRDQSSCLNALSHIKRRTLSKAAASGVSYYVLLNKLSEFRAKHPQEYELSNDTPSLFVLGESHCLPPAHLAVSLNGSQFRVEPKLIKGCQAWHLANKHNNVYKLQFERLSNAIAIGSKAVVMFGEIDCRADEMGILQHHRRTGNELSEVIYTLVKSYVTYVISVFDLREITPIFYGVPARITRKTAQLSDDETMLSNIIKEFNQALLNETNKRNVPFLDIYALTNDNNGQSSGQFHIDSIHVLPSALGDLIRQL